MQAIQNDSHSISSTLTRPVLRTIGNPNRSVRSRMRVLAIEDDRAIHGLYTAALDEDHFSLISRYDGKTGLNAATALKPDLILLDLDLPDMSGVFICRYLKQDVRTHNIPIIFVTGAMSMEEMLSSVDLDASDFLLKPFDQDELSSRIAQALRRHEIGTCTTAGLLPDDRSDRPGRVRHLRLSANWSEMQSAATQYQMMLDYCYDNVRRPHRERPIN